MTKVLTVGVYDYFHLGHLRLFKNARKLATKGACRGIESSG